MYIPPGVTLCTVDFNDDLNINIAEIDVAEGTSVEIGTRGSNDGFKFKHSVEINGFGILSVVDSVGGIFIPDGNGITSSINIFSGDTFTSVVVTFLQLVDTVTGTNIGAPVQFSTIRIQRCFVTISATGIITISTTSMNEF